MSSLAQLPPTPPIDSHLPPHRADSPSPNPNNPDPGSGTQTPPIKTTTNTVPHLTQPQPQTASSIPGTPSLDIPGAYPREDSDTTPARGSTSAARQGTSEPTISYLSAGPASYLTGAKPVSLPSMEKEGVMPGEHHDGVGPLPGSISETSVAKLPDERSASARKTGAGVAAVSLPSQERTGVQPFEHHDGVGPLPGSRSESSVAKLPDERLASASKTGPAAAVAVAAAAAGLSLPSQESTGVHPCERHDGVGPLPGSKSETSVANPADEEPGAAPEGPAAASALSQERTEDTAAPSESRAPAASFGALGVTSQGTQVRRVDPQNPESDQKVSERDDQQADRKNVPTEPESKEAFETEEVTQSRESQGGSKGVESRTAEEQTRPKEQEREKVLAPAQRKARASSDSDASNHKKASVLNRVKGEMKVLLGKASRNKDRVEEGVRLKQGSD